MATLAAARGDIGCSPLAFFVELFLKIDQGDDKPVLGELLPEPNERRLDVFSTLAVFFSRPGARGRIFPVLAEAERSSLKELVDLFLTVGDQFSLATRVYLTLGLEGGVPSEITLICLFGPSVLGERLNGRCCNFIFSSSLTFREVLPEDEFRSMLDTGEGLRSFVITSGESPLEVGCDTLSELVE